MAFLRRTSSNQSQQLLALQRPLTQQRAREEAAKRDAEAARREAGRQRLIPFCQYMWPGFVTTPYRELIAGSLELLEARKITRLMIFAPPQITGKSTIFTQLYPAWYMGRHPDHSQIICSYNADLAASHSFLARNYVEEPAFARLFGELSSQEVPVQIADESRAVKQWRLKNHRGKVLAAGVGGGITGHGAAQGLIDDPVKDAKEADSELIQQRHIEWFKTAFVKRLSTYDPSAPDVLPEGVCAITMTRWNLNDLCGRLLQEQASGGTPWYVLRLPLVAESKQKIAEYCMKNHIPPERYIVADMLPPKHERGFS